MGGNGRVNTTKMRGELENKDPTFIQPQYLMNSLLKSVLVLCLVAASTILIAQVIPKNPNQTDKSNRRQGKWTVWFTNDWVTTKNKDSIAFYRLVEYKDDKPFGKVYDFFASGRPQMEGTLLADRPKDQIDYSKPLRYFDASGKEDVILTLIDQAGYYRDLKDYAAAIPFEEKLVLAIKNTPGLNATSYNGYANYSNEVTVLAHLYSMTGNLPKAEQWFSEALKVKEESGDTQNQQYSFVLESLADLYKQERNFPKAAALALKSVKLQEKQGKETNAYADAILTLADICAAMHNYTNAETLYLEAIRIKEKTLGTKSESYRLAVLNTSYFYKDKGDYSKSESLLLLLVKYAESEGGKESVSYAMSIEVLGRLYLKMNKRPEAEQLFRECADIRAKVTGKQNAEYNAALGAVALVKRLEGKYAESESLYIEILGIQERLTGKDHQDYALTLNRLGIVNGLMGNLAKAEQLSLQGIEIQKKLDSTNYVYADHLNGLAGVYTSLHNYSKAEGIFLKALDVVKKSSGIVHPNYAFYLDNFGNMYRQMGNPQDGEELLALALRIQAKITGKESETYSLYLRDLSLTHMDMVSYAKAEAEFTEALAIQEKINSKEHPDYAYFLDDFAKLKKTMGQYGLAEQLYRESIRINEKVLGRETLSYVDRLNNLANMLSEIGDYRKAEPLCLEALQVAERVAGKQSFAYAVALLTLGSLYDAEGNTVRAQPLLEEATQVFEKVHATENPKFSLCLNNLALVYEKLNRFGEAAELYKASLKITARVIGPLTADYLRSLSNLARLYRAAGLYHAAEAHFREIVDASVKVAGKNYLSIATYVGRLADVYAGMSDYAKGEKLYLTALKSLESKVGKDHPAYTDLEVRLAKMYCQMGKYAMAEPLYSNMRNTVLNQIDNNFPAFSDFEKEAYFNSIRGYFEDFNAFCLASYSKNPAVARDMYDMQLATKGLLLKNSSKWKHRIRNSGDKQLAALYTAWEANQAVLAKWYREADSLKTNTIDSLEKITNTQEKELSRRSEIFATIADKTRIGWEDVKARLKPGEVAIEMIRVNRFGLFQPRVDSSDSKLPAYSLFDVTDSVTYAAAIISPLSQAPELVLLKDGNELEGKYLKYYSNSIRSQTEDKKSYDLFWKPIADRIAQMTKQSMATLRVYFSADGVYNQINLNTLMNAGTRQYLADETKITLVTNTRDLVVMPKEETPNKQAYLFGYPDYELSAQARSKLIAKERDTQTSFYSLTVERGNLLEELPGTKEEVESIAALLSGKGWQPNVFTGKEALEETLKDCLNPRVLHIATHGYFQATAAGKQNPLLRCGLMLAGAGQSLDGKKDDKTEDGILTAYEAMNLNLDNTDLVVLSACETGMGEVRNGEGVYGLQRAFKVAGAKTIIMSLWKVNDEATSELMTTFYSNWLKTGNKRSSFELAQQTLKTKYKLPYYWGAFVMVGE
jgi:CHAT domain-containing protein